MCYYTIYFPVEIAGLDVVKSPKSIVANILLAPHRGRKIFTTGLPRQYSFVYAYYYRMLEKRRVFLVAPICACLPKEGLDNVAIGELSR